MVPPKVLRVMVNIDLAVGGRAMAQGESHILNVCCHMVFCIFYRKKQLLCQKILNLNWHPEPGVSDSVFIV